MRRFAVLLILAVCLVPASFAQENDHIQVGVFADYLRLSQTNTNFGGLGGRLAFTGFHELKFEGEMAYDFDQVFTEGFTDNSTGTVSIDRSNLRVLHGMFGPKFEIGHFPIHPFVTVKGGFMDFRFDNRPATLDTFASTVEGLRARNVNGVFYPGGGLEGRIGPVGLRLDVGDEMYFNSGTHSNLRVAFGPYIRF
ncbi:MAG TPA: hypothetical protein VGI46_15490 [Candidatus Acidoferrum sp.]|jgi:hypothetical protein